jgi:hypothetical protein
MKFYSITDSLNTEQCRRYAEELRNKVLLPDKHLNIHVQENVFSAYTLLC